MSSRRSFLKRTAVFSTFMGSGFFAKAFGSHQPFKSDGNPVVISTWNHGIPANAAAWNILKAGGASVNAVEAGVRVPESDPNITSVGYGGYPDRDGRVTLDACIMDSSGNCGAVACLEHIENPISVARKVMDNTPHVMIVGQGALEFALDQGFEKKNLLTPQAKQALKNWQKEAKYKPIINIENHDTIGMLAVDKNGDISGACTTSGLAFKMHGRVGDSPIIAAGLFVDNEIGGATATGMGEAVIRVAGSHLVVELMRQGYDPEAACKAAIDRIVKRDPSFKDIQIGFLALRKDGAVGGYAIHKGFNYALMNGADDNNMVDVKHMI